MLLVKTYINKSPIDGIGLFASERIPKGTRVLEYHKNFDRFYEPHELEEFPSHLQKYIEIYSYLSMFTGRYVLSCDNDKYANHSNTPNVIADPGIFVNDEPVFVAVRDIEQDEEITYDYRQFTTKTDLPEEAFMEKS